MKTLLKLFCILCYSFSFASSYFYQNEVKAEICFFSIQNHELYEKIQRRIEKYSGCIEIVGNLDNKSEKLHIIADSHLIPFRYFPKNYIIIQTLDLEEIPLTNDYLEKMQGAIAIWDPNPKNICKYSLINQQYYHLNEEMLDPILLPCFLSSKAYGPYRELLKYSNSINTDISSHLPIIYAHSMLQNPKLVIEVGVRSGESSRAFKSVGDGNSLKIIGIDINESSSNVYNRLGISNGEFKHMDDLAFNQWWSQSEFAHRKAEIIFIDTSHYYEHTLQEIEIFLPVLSDAGMFIFHDSHMCPLEKNIYQRINFTSGKGWDNKRGVVRAIQDFFNITFEEDKLVQMNFSSHGSQWDLLHYPFCNGLTLIKKRN